VSALDTILIRIEVGLAMVLSLCPEGRIPGRRAN
jgi:hypothetical protein